MQNEVMPLFHFAICIALLSNWAISIQCNQLIDNHLITKFSERPKAPSCAMRTPIDTKNLNQFEIERKLHGIGNGRAWQSDKWMKRDVCHKAQFQVTLHDMNNSKDF